MVSCCAIKSFYSRPEVCARLNGKQSKPFHVGVGLRQGCVLSPLLFVVYLNWIDKCIQADECATIGNSKISRILFADDLVLLSSTESGLQRALNSFADACNTAGMNSAVMRTLHYSVVMKRNIVEKGKALNFQNSFCPHPHLWSRMVMTKRVRSQAQASEMRFLRRIKGVALFNKVRSYEIQKSLNTPNIERSRLR